MVVSINLLARNSQERMDADGLPLVGPGVDLTKVYDKELYYLDFGGIF